MGGLWRLRMRVGGGWRVIERAGDEIVCMARDVRGMCMFMLLDE